MGPGDLTQVLLLPRQRLYSLSHFSSLYLGTLKEQKPQPVCKGRTQGSHGQGQRTQEHCQPEEGLAARSRPLSYASGFPSPLFRQLRASSTPKVGSLENYIALIPHKTEGTFLLALMEIPG